MRNKTEGLCDTVPDKMSFGDIIIECRHETHKTQLLNIQPDLENCRLYAGFYCSLFCLK